MKANCFNCGKEFEWEPEEDYQPCGYCDGTGNDETMNNCIFCKGTGFIDLNEDDIPICEDCLMKEEDEDYKEADHETPA